MNRFLHLLISLLVFSSISSCTKSTQTAIKPTVDSITVSVYANATLESANQYSLFPGVSGRVVAILKKEGDKINSGETLIQLENVQAYANFATATGALDNAKNNEKQLQDLTTQLATQLDQLQLDSANYVRQKRLWEQQIGSYSQLELKKLAYQASMNSVKVLKNKIQVTSKQLSFNSQQAQNTVQSNKKILSDFHISASIAGEIFQLNAKIGDWVSPVKPVAIIGNSNHFVLRLNVDEMDIAQIRENQISIVSLDAYPGKAFKAHISRIIPIMDPKNQSFTVEALFDEQPEKLYPGLSAEVNVITHTKPKALLIPLSYLGKNNTVNTAEGEIQVKPGLKNLQWVEILEGLTPNSEILEPEKKK